MKNMTKSPIQITKVVCICIVNLFVSTSAYADVQVFTERAAWEAAVVSANAGQIFVEDFNGIPPITLPNNGSTEVGNLIIEGINAGGPRIDDGSNPRNIDGSHFFRVLLDGNPIRSARITFPAAVVAWGMDYNQASDPTHVTFESVVELPIGPNNSSGFIGFIADAEFDDVLFTDPFISFSVIGMDNISYVSAFTLIGDINLDGTVDLLDVSPMVELLANGGFQAEADTNGDGEVDLLDITPFVNLLTGT